jgi:predicted DNA-binding transcriptional regulator AlpA
MTDSSDTIPDPTEEKALPQRAGVCAELANLPIAAIITEEALAGMLELSAKSIKRAVKRGELPPPVPFAGKLRWTAGSIFQHIERRLHEAERLAEENRRRLDSYRPG